jgi:Flp pilus assembly pilin Flp
VVTMSSKWITFKAGEKGQTMAEYTVVLSMITLAIVTTIALLSGAINDMYQSTVDIVSSAF